MSYTPGPWTTEPTRKFGTYRILEVDSRHSEMLWRGEFQAMRAEDEANARLISAAPDMYDALKEVIYFLEGEVEQRSESGLDEYLQAAHAVLRECEGAIAKAERG